MSKKDSVTVIAVKILLLAILVASVIHLLFKIFVGK